MLEIVGGWEPREAVGYAVCCSSLRHANEPVRVTALRERAVRHIGLYKRPHEYREGRMWCPISEAPIATSFANSRFLVPWMATEQWVLWCDFVDMLFTRDPAELFSLADPKFAVMVVKHKHEPDEQTKMDAQQQTTYYRKNWSSLILWNREHPANAKLTVDMVNTLPGRDLHRFCWLEDDEIGALPTEWNHLVGVDPIGMEYLGRAPGLLHFTLGLPSMPGYESGPWASMWLRELRILDGTRLRLPIEARS